MESRPCLELCPRLTFGRRRGCLRLILQVSFVLEWELAWTFSTINPRLRMRKASSARSATTSTRPAMTQIEASGRPRTAGSAATVNVAPIAPLAAAVRFQIDCITQSIPETCGDRTAFGLWLNLGLGGGA